MTKNKALASPRSRVKGKKPIENIEKIKMKKKVSHFFHSFDYIALQRHPCFRYFEGVSVTNVKNSSKLLGLGRKYKNIQKCQKN